MTIKILTLLGFWFLLAANWGSLLGFCLSLDFDKYSVYFMAIPFIAGVSLLSLAGSIAYLKGQNNE